MILVINVFKSLEFAFDILKKGKMNDKIITERLKAIRQQLEKRRIDCLIITKPVNVTYVTGFSGDDSWAVITDRKVYLLTDSRYTEQAQKECLSCQIIVRTGTMSVSVAGLLKKLKSIKTAGLEESSTITSLIKLKKHLNIKIKPVSNLVELVRSIKDRTEIKAVKTAVNIAANAFEKVKRNIKAGITENELAGRLELEIRKSGAMNSFETIVAFGPNASQPHHKPDGRKLKKNDNVLIDFGVKYKGYCSDLTRCFSVGRVNPLYKKVFKAVEEAQAVAIRMIKAGVKINHVDAAARAVIKKYNLPVFGHGTGHGLGLEVHEEPVISGKSKGTLLAGHVITIEPGVYLPGKLGIRIEDDILVTETGYEILSSNCSPD